VVRTINTTQYKAGDPSGYGIGDPSGVAYVPGANILFVADSEHDESPYYSSTNLWAIRPDGTSVGAYSLRSFTREPTGLAYNPQNGFLYITDDDKQKVFWVDPANPALKVGEFSVSALGITDAEDPKFDPLTGNIYLLDGLARTLFELTPTGGFVRSLTLPSVITDAEGLAYSPEHDVFFIASYATRGSIFEIDGDGNLLGTINTLNSPAYYNPAYGSRPYLKGLELALSSNPDDGGRLSLYAVDYGKDQQNDGRLFELDLGPGWTRGTGGTTLVASRAEPGTTADGGSSTALLAEAVADPAVLNFEPSASSTHAAYHPFPAWERVAELRDMPALPSPNEHIV
jgi:DNA-binding beta-propeller fold protein YncE